jgi:dipeptidyl aminopeptidase/acylaminoacyl peptidase
MTAAANVPEVKIARYGSWESPISAEMLASMATSINFMLNDSSATYLWELRPQNQGRYTIVRCQADGTCTDATPPDFDVRSCVHEYGGAPFAVRQGTICASNGADHALYLIAPGQAPQKLTAGQVKDEATHKWIGTRYADLQMAPHGIFAVGERHSAQGKVENFLAFIDYTTGKEKVLAAGCDFYSSPAVSEDGQKIAWICWNHPHMPWTESELWMADLQTDGSLQNARKIAGDLPEAIMQPKWSPNGVLYFISDRERGWWNLHRLLDERIENVCPCSSEVGDPPWSFGRSAYAFLDSKQDTKLLFSYQTEGEFNLALIDLQTKTRQNFLRRSANLHQLRSGDGYVRFIENYVDKELALMQLDNQPDSPIKPLFALPTKVDAGYISRPVHYMFPSGHRMAYGLYYPPHNKQYKAPTNERPPLIVMIHGGPTSQARSDFSLAKQYWTSRGYALFDINYAGSTGYGRAYRQLLNNQWGVYDVEDCIAGALWLVKQGLVNRNRLFIRGGSAGGFTTLAVLAACNLFRGGASYYGVADITALAHDTHKFEARYMEQLVGKYPEQKQLWEQRSPLHSVDKIGTPLIIFQGGKDAIVPQNQSEWIYAALKKKNIPVELHLYPEEGHGFKQAANLVHSLTQEAAFYQKL